ncbi:hypothetical protein [Haloarchaeobius sp. HRN-SO-5]|uniref:hypothetical protein n=1 Tax=Haloarchaeobius sp. HRN-SO-5 TaxID=3446118 RepID=UPI003EB9E20D
MQNPLERLVQYVWQRNPFLLSHHPSCAYYAHHTFELYGAQLCLGCFVVYPVGFASLAGLTALRLAVTGLFAAETVLFYAVGALLAGPLLVSKALVDVRSVRWRVLTKALLAMGLAVAAMPVLFRPADRLVGGLLVAGFLVVYVGFKGLTALDDCEGCPERDDFPHCSGLEFDGE